jgi:hypothetical protein
MYSHIVSAFSFDNLLLSFKTSSQNLCVVKPSVASVIFLSNIVSPMLSFLMEDDNDDACTSAAISTGDNDIDGVNILAIELFERLTI